MKLCVYSFVDGTGGHVGNDGTLRGLTSYSLKKRLPLLYTIKIKRIYAVLVNRAMTPPFYVLTGLATSLAILRILYIFKTILLLGMCLHFKGPDWSDHY